MGWKDIIITRIKKKEKEDKHSNNNDISKHNSSNLEERFLQTRLGWSKLFGYPIPKHANEVTYTLGGTIVVLGIVQLITGIILQQFYIPSSSSTPGAYESVTQIANSANLAFVRNLHYWGANILIIIALLHMARVFIAGAYKKPREVQWLAGVGLLAMLFAFSYTGTVLKWDQEGEEALAHQIGISKTMGPLGIFLVQQFAPGVSLLTRIYALHVTIIPTLAIPVLGLHLILIKLNGISNPKIVDRYKHLISTVEKTVPFSTHIKRMFVYGAAVTVIAIILSALSSAPLYFKAVEGIEVTKPPWYLLWLYPLENVFGMPAISYASGLMIILLAAVPLVDKKDTATDPRVRKKMIKAMFGLLLIFTALLILGSVLPSMQHSA
jgi:ubiquinol-cytochrome c reductase cytochrome b subunit